MFIASTVVLSSSKLLLGTGASETVPILADGDAAGGFQRYCLKRIVQGPRFEETKNDPTVTRVGYSKSCIRASTAVIMVVIITILMVVIIMVVIISSSNSSNNNNGSILGRENMVGVNMLLAYYPQHTLYLRISISISVTFCWCPAVSTVLQGVRLFRSGQSGQKAKLTVELSSLPSPRLGHQERLTTIQTSHPLTRKGLDHTASLIELNLPIHNHTQDS